MASIRIEVFASVEDKPEPTRAFVAMVQVVEIFTLPDRRVERVTANVTIYARTAQDARQEAEEWLAKERAKDAAAEQLAAQRRAKRASE